MNDRHDPPAEAISRRLLTRLEELNGRLAKIDQF